MPHHRVWLHSLRRPQRTGFSQGRLALRQPSHPHRLRHHSLALANRSLVLILDLSHGTNPASLRVKIRPTLSPIEAEYVSAIEWLVFDDFRVIALGTSCGIVYPARILRLRVHGTKKVNTLDTSSEEICVAMPGLIARFDGSEIQSMLQRWFQETSSQFWDQKRDADDSGSSHGRLPYQLWNVNKYGSCADAAITGIMPPPLLEQQSSQRYYCAVTIGDDAAISAFRLSEDHGRSLVGAILSKVVPATFSTIASFSKMIWRSEQKSTKKREAKPQPFARASLLMCLKDYPRKGEKLTLSPSGTLAAITDSLGRILLLDTRALIVVRLWKGYREANCLFMEMLVNKDTATSSSNYYEHVKSDYCLCLAIHAPRKGIIECLADEDRTPTSRHSMYKREQNTATHLQIWVVIHVSFILCSFGGFFVECGSLFV
ncbi:unnamed protein product [Camellia sinensis]